MSTSRRKFVQQFSAALAAIPLTKNIFPEKNNMKNKINGGTTPNAGQDSSTADILVDKLIEWDVKVIFGIVGDGINPIIESLRKRQDKIKFITVRHEEAAAFMASGYAKYTGKLGVCIATTGPGAVHLLNGLYDASMEQAPVLAITGTVDHDLIGTQFTQEVDTIAMLQNITVFNKLITGPQHALTMVDLACRTALATPGVSHITIATDIQQQIIQSDKRSKKSGALKGSSSYVRNVEMPEENELQQAADILNAGKKIMILVGRGALQANVEVQQLADKLGAPVAKALLGKAVLPDNSPFTTGGTGRLGTLPSKEMMQECDTLVILGSNMPHLEYYPDSSKCRAIQVDREANRIGLRFPVEKGLIGDVKATLIALLKKVHYHDDRSFLKLSQDKMVAWRTTLAKLELRTTTPIKPPFLVSKVSALLNDDAVIAIDTGAHTVFTARHLQIKGRQQLAVCGNLASMAPGLPYAIAAAVAYPGRQVVAFVGDGGFTMLMGEMATAVLYNLPIKIILFKNNALAMDRFEQEEIGSKDYGISLLPIDFVKMSEACGAEGYHCSDPNMLESILKNALASSKPAVIEIEIDPDEAPSPPGEIKI